MNINVLSDRLREYNAWRRGGDGPQPDPTEIGELIESAAARLEVLERETTNYFDRWHETRRKLEAFERDCT
jgi:hypothetical protein